MATILPKQKLSGAYFRNSESNGLYEHCFVLCRGLLICLQIFHYKGPGVLFFGPALLKACKNIASHCKDLSSEQAYIFGLLHDIGRYAGVSSERHLIDGYRYCMERGWEKAAQICISHAFMIQDIATSIGVFDVSDEDYLFMKEFVANAVYDDYDRLVQLCDALAMPTGFCLLEKRFVDVTMRYGVHPATIDRWKKILEIKERFEDQIGCSIYSLLPGIVENSFR